MTEPSATNFRPHRGLLAFALLVCIIASFDIFSSRSLSVQLKSYLSAEDVSRANHNATWYVGSFVKNCASRFIGGDPSSNDGNDDYYDDDFDNDIDDDLDENTEYEDYITSEIADIFSLDKTNPRTVDEGEDLNQNNESPASPACHPHFQLALPGGQWTNEKKFKRIYFYHARKAGGSSMHKYLAKVADHYGIELTAVEWSAMEEPGTFDNDTFYITHLREPVDRSISHFKYQGRWDCKDLIKKSFTPTERDANKLETWNQTGGHEPTSCRWNRLNRRYSFFLGMCAVNCYTQWFSGLSCPGYNISTMQQYQVAKARVLRFNMIVVIEKLRDLTYVDAVENFFGVTGITEKGTPYCERESHKANSKFPLTIRNETRESLRRLNELDIRLYHELSDCLNDGQYNFPSWNPDHFALHSYNATAAKEAVKKAKAAKKRLKEAGAMNWNSTERLDE